MTTEPTRAELDKKLDRIEAKLDALNILLLGDDTGKFGIVHQHKILWRLIALWPLCTLSAAASSLFTLAVQWLLR